MRLLKPIAIFLFFIAILGIAGAAVAEKRVALIIGNGKYPRTIGALKNPPNDARLMAKTLRRLNFEVIETIDGSEKAMKKAIRAFGKRLDVAGKDGVGLFYYAGHGVQVKGLNYLIPIDAEIETEGDVDLSAINANSVLRMMEFSGSRLSFVILDACRNNPFARGFRSSSKGLARLEAPKGSLVAYATAPGNVAADGRGTNSPYTTALVRGLLSGQPVERMFREVRNTVMRTTREKQTPWESSSLTGGDFYFSPPKKTLTQTQTAALTPGPETKPAAPDVIPMEDELTALKNANVRSAPTAESEKLGRLTKGSLAAVTGKTTVRGAIWYKVALANGTSGFVYGTLLGTPAVPAPKPQPQDTPSDVIAWQAIQKSTNPVDFETYIRAYPKSLFAVFARNRLTSLKKTQTATVTTPPPVPRTRPKVQPAVGVFPKRYKPGDTFKDCANCPEMVVIPAGSFRMGNISGVKEDFEKPVHTVTIPKPFAVGKFEVTQAEWHSIMGNNPSEFKGDRNPVEKVSWNEAKAFVNKLSVKSGKQYRLLSEAEWEYMARANSTTKYPFGNSEGSLCSYGNGADTSTDFTWRNKSCSDGYGRQTAPVGSFKSNSFGIYDAAGNTWEWVEDCWNGNYNGAPTNGKSWTNTGDCSKRVLRGGSWEDAPRVLRSAFRSNLPTGGQYDSGGFRVSRDLK